MIKLILALSFVSFGALAEQSSWKLVEGQRAKDIRKNVVAVVGKYTSKSCTGQSVEEGKDPAATPINGVAILTAIEDNSDGLWVSKDQSQPLILFMHKMRGANNFETEVYVFTSKDRKNILEVRATQKVFKAVYDNFGTIDEPLYETRMILTKTVSAICK